MSNNRIKYYPETAKFEHDKDSPATKKVSLYGWDVDNTQKVRLAANSDGEVKVDPTALDDRYVNTSGDTMTGDLNFPVTGFVMKDTNGIRWRVTMGTNGNLTSEEIIITNTGKPYGLLLLLTQP